MTSHLRHSLRPNQIPLDVIAKGLRELLRGRRRLRNAVEESVNGHVGNAGAPRELGGLPSARGHVFGHQLVVEPNSRRRGCHCGTDVTPHQLPLSTTESNSVPHWQTAEATISPVPRARPVFHQELGEFFTGLREAKKWTLRRAATISESKGLRALTRQILFRLERGQIKNPEPEVLRAASRLYQLPYEDLVARFTASSYGVKAESTGEIRDRSLRIATPKNKLEGVTRSDTPSEVEDHLSETRGDTSHAAAEATAAGSSDRLSTSESAIDAEVRAISDLTRRAELVRRLDKSAADITRVADTIRRTLEPPKAGGHSTRGAGGHSSVHRATTRRGRR